MIALSVERATQPRITSPGTCSFTYCLNSVCMLCGKASRSRSLGKKHMTSVHVLCPVNLYVMCQSITEPPPKKQTPDKCTCPLSCKSVHVMWQNLMDKSPAAHSGNGFRKGDTYWKHMKWVHMEYQINAAFVRNTLLNIKRPWEHKYI